jgi:hypothetical protein
LITIWRNVLLSHLGLFSYTQYFSVDLETVGHTDTGYVLREFVWKMAEFSIAASEADKMYT